MTKLGLSLLGVVMFSSAAFAQTPKPKPVFATPTSFQTCTTSWAFACGKRDASGRTYGTAHERKSCYTYTFAPGGTFTSTGDHGNAAGTYQMIGSTVRITPTNEDGTKGTPFELVLSPDGSKLGTMTRL